MEDLSFADVPDEEKIRIIIASNNRLRGRIKADEIEIKSLLDENQRLSKRLSDINSQSGKIQSLESKIKYFEGYFKTKPKKLFGGIPKIFVIYLTNKGLFHDLEKWYSSNYNKSQKNG